MKSNMKKYISLFLLLFLAGSLITAKPCLAASAQITISSEPEQITVGDDIMVYIAIDSDTSFSNFEANLVYNEDVLKYQGTEAAISGNNGFLKISDMNEFESTKYRKYALKFEAIDVGSCEISFYDNTVKVYDSDSETEMPVSSNVLTINVKAAQTASTNAKLASLVTSPAITPEFNKDVYDYSVNVGYETEKLIITAQPEDNKAKVSISGNDFLEVGENKVIVTVLAQSGDVIEYTIKVIREAASDEETSPEDAEVTPGASTNLLEVIEANGEQFIIYSGKYKIVEPGSDVVIPKGYVMTKLIISGQSVTVYSPQDNLDSRFLLIYAENENGEPGFYQYDRTEKTLQCYQTDAYSVNPNTVTDTEKIMSSKEYRANLNKAAIIIAILCALCALQIFIIIRLYMKKKGYKDDEGME